MKRKPTSPRRPKPKKCVSRTILSDELVAWSRKGTDDANRIRRLTEDRDSLAETSSANLGAYMQAAAERDEARKELAEANAENRKLQAFKDLALGLAQRDLAGNLHIKAEDVRNCLQWQPAWRRFFLQSPKFR